jgi:acyl-CoA synthetase (AMP-forming)/AMP-acid ligase II
MGEVVARGDNIMRGYWRDPEGTAALLRPEGLRTGDLGFMDQEGFLFLQGRESELIKSGGHRIGPQEIEQVLARSPAVRDCAVCGVPHDLLGESIVAYLMLDPALGMTTQKDLLPLCHAELPRFKVPSQFIAVDSLPKGPTGKVLRRELKLWYAEGRGRRI